MLQQYCKQWKIHWKSFLTVQKLSRWSGKFPDSPETFYTVRKLSTLSRKIPDYLETFRTNYKLSRPSRTFPDRLETFQTVWKLSALVYSSVQLMLKIDFMGNFVNACKNFPDAQKLSGRQCRCADGVFLTLLGGGGGVRFKEITLDFPFCKIVFLLFYLSCGLTPNKSMWETCLRAQFVSLNTPAMKNFCCAKFANKKMSEIPRQKN